MEGLNTTMSAAEMANLNNVVNTYNKSLVVNGRTTSNELGKDDFLKLLITQLSNQDPTSPMENTEFIAQMAQFSSLEQISNMNNEFSKLTATFNSSQAVSMIGKTVDLENGDIIVTGNVEAATRGANPQVMVNGMFYDMEKITAIYDN